MKVSDIVLAEYAGVDDDGQFTLVRAGLARMLTDKLPCVIPSLYMFLRLNAERRDKGIHRIDITLAGRHGPFLKAEGSMTVTEDGVDDPRISMPFHFQNITFGTEGRFDFRVSINGLLEATHPFYVKYAAGQPS